MLPVEFDVAGKVVFITGAGRGIGKGIAQVLAEAGADVALNALTPKYVEGTATEIAAASGRRVVPSSPTSRRRTRSAARLIRSLPPLGISTSW
jgi:NAD(P)-dependent dehydrogenase (short-subunit alcohol dehydrogenase family)